MKNKILILIAIFSIFLFNGCNKAENKLENDNFNETYININNPIIVKEEADGEYNLLEISNNKMSSLEKVYNLVDFRYSILSQVKIKLIFVDKGNNLINNKLVVETQNINKSIDNLYSIEDFKLSPHGKYVAYRGFKDDNIESIDNLRLYDVEKDEIIFTNSDVLISGNMYDFKGDDTLIYYGVNPNDGIQGIYEYNINDKSESVIYKVKNGYLMYLSYIKDDLSLILEDNLNTLTLKLINLKTKDNTIISSDIEKIIDYKSVDDIIYFIGKIKNEDLAVYKYKNGTLKRLTYGFPKKVYENSYLSLDKDGNLYFIGYNDNEELRDVYSVTKDDSVNLISNESDKYLIYKNASYFE